MKNVAIGIDLGGTNCRVGIVSDDGKILRQKIVPVGNNRGSQSIIKLLVNNINNSPNPPLKILGIGVGAPGIADFERGTIIRSPHYPGWHNFKLRDELSLACGLPVVLDNDANVIAAGELWRGAGRGIKNFIMITLGTGIGGGIVICGDVFHGDDGFAGEIGHMVQQFDGIKCDCGGKGCWETVVSIEGLKRCSGGKFGPKALSERALKGDDFAKGVWKEFGAHLGAGIASLVNITGIHTVIIGGGISNAWRFFISEAKKEIGRRTYKETAKRIVLKQATLGDSAGILGAAWNVFSKNG